jgi:hypothetical protein
MQWNVARQTLLSYSSPGANNSQIASQYYLFSEAELSLDWIEKEKKNKWMQMISKDLLEIRSGIPLKIKNKPLKKANIKSGLHI